MPNNIIPLHHGIAMRAAWYVCLKIGRSSRKSRPPLQLSLCGSGLGKKWKAPNWNLIGQRRAESKAPGTAQRLEGYPTVPLAAWNGPLLPRLVPLHNVALCTGQPPLRPGTLLCNCRGRGSTGSAYITTQGCNTSIPGAWRSTAGNGFTAHLNQRSTKKNQKWFSEFGQVL